MSGSSSGSPPRAACSSAAVLVNRRAMALPMLREPLCRRHQTAPSRSRQTSTKWLPDPSVPSWSIARFSIRRCPRFTNPSKISGCGIGFSANQRSVRSDTLLWSLPTPAGMERLKRRWMSSRSRAALSRSVLQATIPQPMSTPTAAGMMRSAAVGMTLPTVAPMPKWASGMSATCPATSGARDMTSACRRVLSSSTLAQLLTPLSRVGGVMGFASGVFSS